MEQEQHKISVRLNGKEQKINDVQNKVDSKQEADHELVEDTFIPQPDNVIQLGEVQEQRKKNGQPYWDDGIREKGPKLPFNRKKKPRSQKTKRSFPTMIFMIICSAVIVGVSFGFMVLTIFTGNNAQQVEMGVQTASDVPTFGEGVVGMPVFTVDVVQGGAYSDQVKGEETVKRIQEKGFAAALTKGTEPVYLFIGLGGDRAQSSAISQLYEGHNQEMYLKTYRVENKLDEVDSEVTDWFFEASGSFKDMVQLTVDGLTREGASLTSGQVEQMNEQLALLQGKRDGAFEKLPDQVQPHALEMGDALVQAGKALEKYVKTEDKQQLWSAQNELLHALISYEQVINDWE
ncbi:hypothetical protein [Halalkalibacter urbisdiaboli]|uniref:hypothetical protein n=1 Tax=Halalkalibacter urbisdiaboli TaxID=1960589 RepID=UPI000B443594|nr:hypothetical protein [Halalkalibacter urbisdiaboli]